MYCRLKDCLEDLGNPPFVIFRVQHSRLQSVLGMITIFKGLGRYSLALFEAMHDCEVASQRL